MKSILILSLLLAVTAHARPEVIARIYRSGGMPGPDGQPTTYETLVYSDGNVTKKFSIYPTIHVLTMSPEVVKRNIPGDLSANTIGELEPITLPEAGCKSGENASEVTNVSVKGVNGQMVSIGGVKDCSELAAANESILVGRLRSILKAIATLSNNTY